MHTKLLVKNLFTLNHWWPGLAVAGFQRLGIRSAGAVRQLPWRRWCNAAGQRRRGIGRKCRVRDWQGLFPYPGGNSPLTGVCSSYWEGLETCWRGLRPDFAATPRGKSIRSLTPDEAIRVVGKGPLLGDQELWPLSQSPLRMSFLSSFPGSWASLIVDCFTLVFKFFIATN